MVTAHVNVVKRLQRPPTMQLLSLFLIALQRGNEPWVLKLPSFNMLAIKATCESVFFHAQFSQGFYYFSAAVTAL